MTAPIVPIERITRGVDRFRCPWLHTTLTADTCIARQTATRDEGARNAQTGTPRTGTPTYPACARCDLGREVRARRDGTWCPPPPPEPVAVPVPEPTPPEAPAAARTCAVEGCPNTVALDAPALALCNGCKGDWL
jgi:hypothetical protein